MPDKAKQHLDTFYKILLLCCVVGGWVWHASAFSTRLTHVETKTDKHGDQITAIRSDVDKLGTRVHDHLNTP